MSANLLTREPDPQVHELLKRGLERLERPSPNGWAQAYQGEALTPGEVCAWLAIPIALGEFDALRALARAAGLPSEGPIRHVQIAVADWNDAQPSFAPVKAAYCRAIEATAPETSDGQGIATLAVENPRARAHASAE